MSRRHKAAAAPALPPARSPVAEPLFWCLLACGLLYAGIATATSGDGGWALLGVIDGQQLFAIDDAWRYYLAKTAWSNPGLYAWSYMLPGTVLIDGLLATLAQGDLLILRLLHIPAALLTLWFIYGTGLRLGAARWMMTLATLLLALMPLFGFVFISFYGENWLTLALAAGMWSFVAGRERSAAVAFALLPLLRPEGIFLVAPLALHWLLQRRWRLLALLGAPGFLYGIVLLAVVHPVTDYTRWRLELLAILQHAQDPAMRRTFGVLDAFNPLWTLPALLALCLPPLRRAWPVLAGGALWLLTAMLFVATGNSFHEARYYLSALPALAIGFPFFFVWLGGALAPRMQRARLLTGGLFAALALFVTAEHCLQFDPFKAWFGNQRWPNPGLPAAREFFGTLSPQANHVRRATAEAIANIVAGNPEIDRVLITNTELFYYLDPALEKHVQVVYVPTNEAVAGQWLQGRYFGIFPSPHGYAWYRLRALDSASAHHVLFVGNLTADSAPVYSAGIFSIHLVDADIDDDRQP